LDFLTVKKKNSNVDYDNITSVYNKPPFDSWFAYKEIKFNEDDIKRVDILDGTGSFLLYNIFSKDECEHLINETEKIGYEDLQGFIILILY
jgi:hypothetical protein